MQRRFSRSAPSATFVSQSSVPATSLPPPSDAKTAASKEAVKKALQIDQKPVIKRAVAKDATKVTISFKGALDDDGELLTLKQQFDEKISLATAIDSLLKESPFVTWSSLEMRFPLPRRVISHKSSELKRFLCISIKSFFHVIMVFATFSTLLALAGEGRSINIYCK